MRIITIPFILCCLLLASCSQSKKAFKSWMAIEHVEIAEFRAPSAETGALMASDSGRYFHLTLKELTYRLPANGKFNIKDRTLLLSRVSSRDRLKFGNAINPKVTMHPAIEEVRVEKVVLYSPAFGQKLVDGIIHRIITDTLLVSSIEYPSGMVPPLLTDMGPAIGQAAEQLRQELENVIAQFPAHAAFMAQPELQQLLDSMGRFQAKTLHLSFESLRECVPEYINIIDWANTSLDQLKNPENQPQNSHIYFYTGKYTREESFGWEQLQAILEATKRELLANYPVSIPYTLSIRLSGYADEQEIFGNLKAELEQFERDSCPAGPEKQPCLNLRLSDKRTATVETFCQAYFQKIDWPSLHVSLRLEGEGYGWELPGNYNGRCQEKDCQDRRVTIISKLLLPNLGGKDRKPD
ncbi:MAG: hypothetical protein IPM81_05135 [Saprospirales bacterium]|nr:hypothetical protein [Saprospirales bacterium]